MNASLSPTPLRIVPKIGKNAIGCAVIGVAAALFGFALLVVALAKTGVVHIPFVSRLYRGPVPTRLVAAQPMTPAAFKVLLSSRFIAQAVAHVPPPYTVQVTEKELTGAVMDAIDSALRDGHWRQVYSQIAIRNSDIELYGQFERAPLHVDILVRFQPVVLEGGVRFDPVFVQMGDYPLPPSAAYRIASSIFSRDLGTWVIRFGEASLRSLKLRDGVIEITAMSSTSS